MTAWKRFGAVEVIRAAQTVVRNDAEPMAIPWEEFTEEGAVRGLMVQEGFAERDVKVWEKEVVVKQGMEEMEGLKGFLVNGELTKAARKGWSVEEEGRWEAAVEEALMREVERHKGVLFEAWVLVGKK